MPALHTLRSTSHLSRLGGKCKIFLQRICEAALGLWHFWGICCSDVCFLSSLSEHSRAAHYADSLGLRHRQHSQFRHMLIGPVKNDENQTLTIIYKNTSGNPIMVQKVDISEQTRTFGQPTFDASFKLWRTFLIAKKKSDNIFFYYMPLIIFYFFLCVKVLRAKRTAEQECLLYEKNILLFFCCYFSWLCEPKKSCFVG